MWIEEQVWLTVPKNDCYSNNDCGTGLRCVGGQCIDVFGDFCEPSYNGETESVLTTIRRYVANPDLPSDGVVPLATQFLPGSARTESITGVTHFNEQSSFQVRSTIGRQFRGTTVDPVFNVIGCSF